MVATTAETLIVEDVEAIVGTLAHDLSQRLLGGRGHQRGRRPEAGEEAEA